MCWVKYMCRFYSTLLLTEMHVLSSRYTLRYLHNKPRTFIPDKVRSENAPSHTGCSFLIENNLSAWFRENSVVYMEHKRRCWTKSHFLFAQTTSILHYISISLKYMACLFNNNHWKLRVLKKYCQHREQ